MKIKFVLMSLMLVLFLVGCGPAFPARSVCRMGGGVSICNNYSQMPAPHNSGVADPHPELIFGLPIGIVIIYWAIKNGFLEKENHAN